MNLNNFVSRHNKQLLYWSLLALFIVFALFNLLSEGSYGGGDDIVHYRFAHFAFKYPGLLLDHWAKPLFTLLASPFAQFGYFGIRIFNVLTGIFTAFFLYKIACILNIRNNWFLPILLFFVPVYASMLLSGMTEILFSFVVVFAIYWMLKEKYIWGAIVISLLPLARTEGIVIWPVFVVALIIKKQWKAIPFLLTGSILYSIIGGFYFNDFLWLITRMPYTGTYDIYGHGELLHFLHATKVIFGLPQALFFTIGLLGAIIVFFIKRERSLLYELLLVFGSLFAFYAAHSYVWWKGINSLGLIRVMACISPLFAIYSLRGLNLFIDAISPSKGFHNYIYALLDNKLKGTLPISMQIQAGLKYLLLAGAFFAIIYTPFKVCSIPVPLAPKELLVKKAANWFQQSEFNNQKIYIWDSYFYFFLGIDPYDNTKMADGIPNRHHPEQGVLPGEIVVWDAHYAAIDGRFPFQDMVTNPYFKLVKVFTPKFEILVGGQPYKMCFFERLDSASHYNNYNILDSLVKAGLPHYVSKHILKNDFEKSISSGPQNLRDSMQADSGKYCLHMLPNHEFFTIYETTAKQLHISDETQIRINISIKKGPVFLVVSLTHRKEIYLYQAKEIAANNEWGKLELNIPLELPKDENDKLSIYLWNQNKHEVFIDNLSADLLTTNSKGK